MEGDRDGSVWFEGLVRRGGGAEGGVQPKIASSHVCCVHGELLNYQKGLLLNAGQIKSSFPPLIFFKGLNEQN